MAPTLTTEDLSTSTSLPSLPTASETSIAFEPDGQGAETAPPATVASSSVFKRQVAGYFEASALVREGMRDRLAGHITRSQEAEQRVIELLHVLAECPCQESIAAAIDVLSLVPEVVPGLSARLALDPSGIAGRRDEDAAFALGVAALAIDPEQWRLLLLSPYSGMREAAVEAIAELPPEDASKALQRVALEDPVPIVRQIAAEYIEELRDS